MREQWDYTRSVQYNVVRENGPNIIVRVHIHYTSPNIVNPGKGWISGIENYDFPTPRWVVKQFSNYPDMEIRYLKERFN